MRQAVTGPILGAAGRRDDRRSDARRPRLPALRAGSNRLAERGRRSLAGQLEQNDRVTDPQDRAVAVDVLEDPGQDVETRGALAPVAGWSTVSHASDPMASSSMSTSSPTTGVTGPRHTTRRSPPGVSHLTMAAPADSTLTRMR